MEVNGYKIEPGADLSYADLEDAWCADLSGAKLDFAIMPDGTFHD